MKRCHDCGVERPWLHRHHIAPKVLGGTNDRSNLIDICGNCHEDRHGGPGGGTLRGHGANSPEARAKKGAKSKEYWSDPEYRERQRQSRIKAWEGRDHAAQAEVMRKNSHALWDDPEARASALESMSAAQKRRWAREREDSN